MTGSTTDPIPHYQYPLPRTSPTEPPCEYAKLRAEQPVCPVALPTGHTAHLVTRYEDVKTVLSDHRFSREALFRDGAPRAQLLEPDADSLISMDPPRHTVVRTLVNSAFTRRRADLLRPAIEAVVSELLDAMAARTGPVDLAEHLARPLTLRIICELIGVPPGDRPRCAAWCDRFASPARYRADEVVRCGAEMRAYFGELIEAKRAEPGPDLFSQLVRAMDEEGRITREELVSMGVMLLVAGHNTTATVFGGGAIALMTHPDQLALLREDPSRWNAAVEEVIRLVTPGDGTFIRVALEDVELSGCVVPEGGAVIGAVSAANRDPSVFRDPDTMDILREDNRHLGFSHGTHFCVGSALARAELQIGLRRLFERFPGLRLAVPADELHWQASVAIGAFEEIPVVW